ncbi:MAG: immunity 17 family protein [Muribaculum sp.]|nr:immunity 17 family protein [Muribaculaceae bacterium]MCM1080262.1 immunity 17 family protein [Muribaculum sp.]
MSITGASRILALLFLVSGTFSLVAALAGWNWFFTTYNVKILTGRLNRNACRFLYALLGVAIIAMGLYTWTIGV